jgi:hypothetical protein
MANKDSAFGLRPVGKVGQNRDNQGLSEYDIAASASAIFQNDPVEMAATGTITVAAATDTLLGSLTGVFFTDASTSKPTFANHLKGSNTATDIKGFVSDDPYERFEIQSDDATAAADVGLNADIVYASGASPNFVSKVELDHSDLKTATAQLRVLAISKDIENNEAGSANVNLVVMINEHFLKGTTGI